MEPVFNDLLDILRRRFDQNMHRHKSVSWSEVENRLQTAPGKLKSLAAMEETGGEPDAIGISDNGEAIFCDCSPESPAGRRSLCYDADALEARKENKPSGSAMDVAAKMGVSLLTETQYIQLQDLGPFDRKTSSWLLTPKKTRNLGGALFGDYRYGRTFIYHNGVQSYYAARGFRAILLI